jgi:ribosomal protein S18 acetylase RimI-like enzyme
LNHTATNEQNRYVSLHFRPATLQDIDPIIGLVRRYYAENGYPFSEPDTRRAIGQLLREPSRGRIWLVDGPTGPAGYVVLTLGYSLEYGGVDAFVDEVYLVPEARGQGAGRRALELVEATCRELGVRALHLEVESNNEPARAVYRKRGFIDHRRLLMTKMLTTET